MTTTVIIKNDANKEQQPDHLIYVSGGSMGVYTNTLYPQDTVTLTIWKGASSITISEAPNVIKPYG